MSEGRFRLTPPAALAEAPVAALLEALPRARLVGGAVRDALAGLPLADLDLATPDRPEAVMDALARAGIRAVPTGITHGTVTAVAGSHPIEITTLRRDVETDGRHATVAFTEDWQQDAARRDFTINAMSMERDGTVHDWFGGRDDLAAGRVRFVGDAARRIAEDYLRALRFFRFQARYGSFAPDPAAVAAVTASVPGLAQLSAERVWSELKRILAAPEPARSVALMGETGVLGAVLPEAGGIERLAGLLRAGAPPDPLLRLASLLRRDAASLAARLRLSGAEADRLAGMKGPVPEPGDDDAALRRALAGTAPATLADRTWLAEAEAAGARGDWADLRGRLAAMPVPVFPLAGADVVAAGIEPGPEVGQVLAALRQDWLAGGCVGDRAAWLAALDADFAGR